MKQEDLEKLALALGLTRPGWANFCGICNARLEECKSGYYSDIFPYECPTHGRLHRSWDIYTQEVQLPIALGTKDGITLARCALAQRLKVVLIEEKDKATVILVNEQDSIHCVSTEKNESLEDVLLYAALQALERGWLHD